jgi:3-oxoacyl-[acyl-carrier protein] reductase
LNLREELLQIYAPKLFSGKNVLVTGGSRGIGRAISIAFGALGAKVIVNYSGNKQAAQETVDEIQGFGGQATFIQFDISNFNQVQETIKNLEPIKFIHKIKF